LTDSISFFNVPLFGGGESLYKGDAVGAFIQLVLMSYLGVAQSIAPLASNTESDTVRFTAWTSYANPSDQLVQLRNAVHKIETQNGTCSATTISSEGHILTARHCLVKCLILSGALQRKSEEGYDYFELSQEALKTARCDIKVDDKPVTVQIEATSPGLIFSFDEKGFQFVSPVKYKELVAKGYTNDGDFAIVKPVGLTEPTPCVGLSERRVQPGDVQQTLGYPSETARPDGHNSNGVDLYYSQGTVISSIFENSCVKSFQPTPYQINNMEKDFNTPTGFMTTLDAIYGSSGTGVADADNHIAGILTNVFRFAEYTKLDSDEPDVRFCLGSARALSTETIRRSLLSQGYDMSTLSCNN
jgi:hypothetical protein